MNVQAMVEFYFVVNIVVSHRDVNMVVGQFQISPSFRSRLGGTESIPSLPGMDADQKRVSMTEFFFGMLLC